MEKGVPERQRDFHSRLNRSRWATSSSQLAIRERIIDCYCDLSRNLDQKMDLLVG